MNYSRLSNSQDDGTDCESETYNLDEQSIPIVCTKLTSLVSPLYHFVQMKEYFSAMIRTRDYGSVGIKRIMVPQQQMKVRLDNEEGLTADTAFSWGGMLYVRPVCLLSPCIEAIIFFTCVL